MVRLWLQCSPLCFNASRQGPPATMTAAPVWAALPLIHVYSVLAVRVWPWKIIQDVEKIQRKTKQTNQIYFWWKNFTWMLNSNFNVIRKNRTKSSKFQNLLQLDNFNVQCWSWTKQMDEIIWSRKTYYLPKQIWIQQFQIEHFASSRESIKRLPRILAEYQACYVNISLKFPPSIWCWLTHQKQYKSEIWSLIGHVTFSEQFYWFQAKSISKKKCLERTFCRRVQENHSWVQTER